MCDTANVYQNPFPFMQLKQNISIQVAFLYLTEFEYIALSEGAYTTKYRVPSKWFRSGKDNLNQI